MIRNGEKQVASVFFFEKRRGNSPVEDLRNAVGRDQAELPDLLFLHQFCGLMPPVHHQIAGFGQARIGPRQGINVTTAKSESTNLIADKGRVPNNKVRFRPLGGFGLFVDFILLLGRLVRDVLTCSRVLFERHSVPAGQGNTVFVDGSFDGTPVQYGVLVLDIFESLDDGFRRGNIPVGLVMPLQVADPEHHFSDMGRARIGFQPEELVRIYGNLFAFQLEAAAVGGEFVDDLSFEPLHVGHRYIKEVSGPAGGIEYASEA